MPRFATQMEAEAAHQAAMERLSTERMTWEEYAATHLTLVWRKMRHAAKTANRNCPHDTVFM
jgi:hypothetical protein